MQEIGQGERVFAAPPVRGMLRSLQAPDDVLDLMDTGAEGVVALVSDAGATFLAPLLHELTAIVCTGGTPSSHIGIVSRDFQLPCVMGATFAGDPPADRTEVELDCSGAHGAIRA